jgi:hypothetical protein
MSRSSKSKSTTSQMIRESTPRFTNQTKSVETIIGHGSSSGSLSMSNDQTIPMSESINSQNRVRIHDARINDNASVLKLKLNKSLNLFCGIDDESGLCIKIVTIMIFLMILIITSMTLYNNPSLEIDNCDNCSLKFISNLEMRIGRFNQVWFKTSFAGIAQTINDIDDDIGTWHLVSGDVSIGCEIGACLPDGSLCLNSTMDFGTYCPYDIPSTNCLIRRHPDMILCFDDHISNSTIPKNKRLMDFIDGISRYSTDLSGLHESLIKQLPGVGLINKIDWLNLIGNSLFLSGLITNVLTIIFHGEQTRK